MKKCVVVTQDEATGASSSSSPRSSPYRGRSTEREISRDRHEISRDQLSTDDGETNGNGRIEFNLKYDSIESTLTLKVIRAVELPAKDFISGTSDPYVKIMLLPEKRSKMSTSIKRRNLNPRWNEIFAFEGNFTQALRDPVALIGCITGLARPSVRLCVRLFRTVS